MNLHNFRGFIKSKLKKVIPDNLIFYLNEIILSIIERIDLQHNEVNEYIDCITQEMFDQSVYEEVHTATLANLCAKIAEFDDLNESKWNFKFFIIKRCKAMLENPLENQLMSIADYWEKKIAMKTNENPSWSDLDEKIRTEKQKYLRNIKFIGELFKNGLLNFGIIHCYILSLIPKSSDEDSINCLYVLLKLCGEKIEELYADKMHDYINSLTTIINNEKLETQIRIRIFEIIEMKQRNWTRKKIQVHRISNEQKLYHFMSTENQNKRNVDINRNQICQKNNSRSTKKEMLNSHETDLSKKVKSMKGGSLLLDNSSNAICNLPSNLKKSEVKKCKSLKSEKDDNDVLKTESNLKIDDPIIVGYLSYHRIEENGSINLNIDSFCHYLKFMLKKIIPQNINFYVNEIKSIFQSSEMQNEEINYFIHCLIQEIFEQAVEAKEERSSILANFCAQIAAFDHENESKLNFKSSLLNRHQETFESLLQGQSRFIKDVWKQKGETENNKKANNFNQFHTKIKIPKIRNEYFNNVRFIGELFMNGLLNSEIIHSYILFLLLKSNDGDSIVSLNKLLEAGDKEINERYKDKMKDLIKCLTEISKNKQLTALIRLKVRKIIEMKEKNWKMKEVQADNIVYLNTLSSPNYSLSVEDQKLNETSIESQSNHNNSKFDDVQPEDNFRNLNSSLEIENVKNSATKDEKLMSLNEMNIESFKRSIAIDSQKFYQFNKQYIPPHMRNKVENSIYSEKSRHLKLILNKLAPQNLNFCVNEMKLILQSSDLQQNQVDEYSDCFIQEIFDKAINEESHCPTYANFCLEISKLEDEVNLKWNFKSILLSKCKQLFEIPLKDQLKYFKNFLGTNDETVTVGKSRYLSIMEEYKRKMIDKYFVNIRFIGELFLNGFINFELIHSFILSLMPNSTDEYSMTSLCKLLETCGKNIDKNYEQIMNDYFKRLTEIIDNEPLETRIRFKILDIFKMKQENWVTPITQIQNITVSNYKLSRRQKKTNAKSAVNQKKEMNNNISTQNTKIKKAKKVNPLLVRVSSENKVFDSIQTSENSNNYISDYPSNLEIRNVKSEMNCIDKPPTNEQMTQNEKLEEIIQDLEILEIALESKISHKIHLEKRRLNIEKELNLLETSISNMKEKKNKLNNLKQNLENTNEM